MEMKNLKFTVEIESMEGFTRTLQRINEETLTTSSFAKDIGFLVWFNETYPGRYDPRYLYMVWR